MHTAAQHCWTVTEQLLLLLCHCKCLWRGACRTLTTAQDANQHVCQASQMFWWKLLSTFLHIVL
jgi:hypothetical protein